MAATDGGRTSWFASAGEQNRVVRADRARSSDPRRRRAATSCRSRSWRRRARRFLRWLLPGDLSHWMGHCAPRNSCPGLTLPARTATVRAVPEAAAYSIYGTDAGDAPAGLRGALGMLDLLAKEGPTDLASLSRELRVPKSTLHRISVVMRRERWLTKEGGRLQLGVRAMALGSRGLDQALLTAFKEVASRLLITYNETLCLVARLEHEVVFLAKEDTRHEVRLVKEVGSRLPAFAAASGRVLLAELPFEQVRTLFADLELITPTGRRIGGIEQLLSELEEVRRCGYAENHADTAPGLYCVAFPVRNTAGTPIAALTFCVPSGRADVDRRHQLRRALEEGAGEISELVRIAEPGVDQLAS